MQQYIICLGTSIFVVKTARLAQEHIIMVIKKAAQAGQHWQVYRCYGDSPDMLLVAEGGINCGW